MLGKGSGSKSNVAGNVFPPFDDPQPAYAMPWALPGN
jgi:hypothetical protein